MAEVIKIAIIAGQLVVGGAEQQLYNWLANLDRKRFDPIVLTLHPGHGDFWEEPIRDLGIPLYEIPERSNKLVRLHQIIRILRPFKPALIHGWHAFPGVYAGFSAKLLGARSVAGIRSSYLPLKGALETKIIRRFCDAVVANSQIAASEYQLAQRPKRQKVFVVQNAVEKNFLDRETARQKLIAIYSLPPDPGWIASIGRMDSLKRFDTLVQVCAELKLAGYDFHLVLIGDGPEKGNLEKLVKENHLNSQVTFTGEVPAARRLLPAFDVFCFSSVAEGSPNVLMEAALAGLAIVAWDLPFNREILPKMNLALLVEPGNQRAMLNALIRLINSETFRQSLGSEAQKHVQTSFGLHRFIEAMTSVYENVLEDK
ncbi:MAG TPA: glycosyltransferase [Chloroflexi bacterium]|nr:glycosyltransferase [Chloroflexota bacterium]